MRWNRTLITSKMNTMKLTEYITAQIWNAASIFLSCSIEGLIFFELFACVLMRFFVQKSIRPNSWSACNCLLNSLVIADFRWKINTGEYIKSRSLVNAKWRSGYFTLNAFCSKLFENATPSILLSCSFRRLSICSKPPIMKLKMQMNIDNKIPQFQCTQYDCTYGTTFPSLPISINHTSNEVECSWRCKYFAIWCTNFLDCIISCWNSVTL